MDRCLCRGAEPRAHVHPFGAQRQRGRQPAPIADAAAGQHRDADLLGRRRDQDQAGDIILARVAGAFEAIDADHVHAHLLRRNGMAHGGALVQHGHAVALEILDMLARVVPGGFHDRHAAIDDRAAIVRIGRRADRGQDRQVHAKRLVGQRAAAVDLAAQVVGRRLGQRGQDAQPPGVGYRARQFGAAHPHHSPLDDGVGNAQKLRDPGLDRHDCTSHRNGTAQRRPQRGAPWPGLGNGTEP